MRGARLMLLTMAASAGCGLTACTTVTHHIVSADQKAFECSQIHAGDPRAPQIMAYDSGSKVETNIQTAGSTAIMTVHDRENARATGVAAEAGRYPETCVADGRDDDHVTVHQVPNPLLVGAVVGAAVGAAATKTGEGAVAGAAIGATIVHAATDGRKGPHHDDH